MISDVVVVFGNKRHGKNELADAIAERLREARGDRVTRAAFADGLKAAAEHMLGIPRDLPDELKEQPRYFGRSARHWWQWLGTEVGRDQVHRDLWPLSFCDRVKKTPFESFVVSDGRFENELRVPKRELEPSGRRVLSVLVYRPGLADPGDLHPSEAEVKAMRERALSGSKVFDVIITNDGTLEDLRARGRDLADSIVAGAAWA